MKVLEAHELVPLIPKTHRYYVKYSEVEVGDIVIDAEEGYPWRVAKVLNDGKRVGIYDEYNSGISCSLKKDFRVEIIRDW